MLFLKKSIYFNICIMIYMLLLFIIPKSLELYAIGIFFIIAFANLIYYIISAIKYLISNKKDFKKILKIVIVLILISTPGNIFMFQGIIYIIFCLICLLLSVITLYAINKF